MLRAQDHGPVRPKYSSLAGQTELAHEFSARLVVAPSDRARVGRTCGLNTLAHAEFAFAHAATSRWVANHTSPFDFAWRMISSTMKMRDR